MFTHAKPPLQRKFVRETGTNRSTLRFHHQAKKWVTDNHGTVSSLTNEEWTLLLQEDILHPYNEYPISYPPAQAENDGECHDTIDEVSGMMSPSLGDPFGLVSPSMVQEGDSLSEEDDYERPKL